MDRELVQKYITLPMAIKVFRQDRDTFAHFSMGNLYQDKINSCIEQLEKDFFELKREMYTVHHLDIKYLGKNNNEVKYKVNNEVITFAPDDLRQLTSDVMADYLYGSKAVPFEVKSRIWTTGPPNLS